MSGGQAAVATGPPSLSRGPGDVASMAAPAQKPLVAGPALMVTASTPEMAISPPASANQASSYFARAGHDAEAQSSSISESSSSAASTTLTDPSSDKATTSAPSPSASSSPMKQTRTAELAKPTLKRPPSLTELTRAMRLDPVRWEKLKAETEQARAADEAAVQSASGPSAPAGGGRLRLQVSSLQRGTESRGTSPVGGTVALPAVSPTASNGEVCGRPALGKTLGRMPSLADIQQRVMARSKSSEGAAQPNGRSPDPSAPLLPDTAPPSKPDALPEPAARTKDNAHSTPDSSQTPDGPVEKTGPVAAESAPSEKAPIPSLVLSETEKKSSATDAPPKNALHPLQHPWTMYFDSKATAAAGKRAVSAASAKDAAEPTTPTVPTTPGGTTLGAHGQAYQAALQTIGTFKTVEDFCRYFNWTKRPSQLEMHSSVQVFKDGIKPMWEDPANADGGKWTLTLKVPNANLLDRLWTYLVLALVGEEVDWHDDVCGATVATRPRGNRIQVWTREKHNVEKINGLGKRLIKTLELNDDSGVSLDFSPHSGTSFAHSGKFISIAGAVATPARPPLPGHSFSTNSIGSPLRRGSGAAPGLSINTSQPVVPFPPHLESLVSPQRRMSIGLEVVPLRRPSMEQLSAIAEQQRRTSVDRPPLLVHHSHHMGMPAPPGMQAVIIPGPPPPGPPVASGPPNGTWRPGVMGMGPPPGLAHMGPVPPRANSLAGPSLAPVISRGPSPVSSPAGRNASLPPQVGLGIDTSGP